MILTSPTAGNTYLVNRLLENHHVAGMVIESPPPALTAEQKYERRRRMLERHGWLRTMNKLAYNWLRWRFLSPREGNVVREAFFPAGRPIRYVREVPTVTVPNINDPMCIETIRRLKPDVLAVCGTTVIKPQVFTLAPLGALNIHTGITPDYRCADPIFWALYCNEPHKVGVTIHFIDEGIDTGPIVRQQAVGVYAEDSLASLYVRCLRRGAELYLEALEELSRGTLRTQERGESKGRAFYSIDLGLVQYLVFCWRFRRLKRRLPHRPAAVGALEVNQ